VLEQRDDADLLRRYRRGDTEAFGVLYARHRVGLYSFLKGLCSDAQLAEEIFQETWLSLIRSDSQQQPERARFRSWLYQIARHRLIDHWRRQGRAAPLESFDESVHDQPQGDGEPEAWLQASQDRERLEQALQELPEEQREVFLLRAHAELELAEIAALTQVPAETVKSRLRYALAKLRRLLAAPLGEEVCR